MRVIERNPVYIYIHIMLPYRYILTYISYSGFAVSAATNPRPLSCLLTCQALMALDLVWFLWTVFSLVGILVSSRLYVLFFLDPLQFNTHNVLVGFLSP